MNESDLTRVAARQAALDADGMAATALDADDTAAAQVAATAAVAYALLALSADH